MNQRIGVIDMGTNTFHLLISEIVNGVSHQMVNEKVSVGLGKGGINKGVITDDAMDRALNVLKHFRHTLNEFDVRSVIATGTSAVRNAVNKDIFIKRIEQETQIQVEVIDGAREAELIFRGVRQAVQMDNKQTLVMDIGGGSVEFIIGNENGIQWKQSFEIGGQRLIERFHKNDPIHPDEIKALHEYLSGILSPLDQAIQKWKPILLIGSAGTFDTLAEINIDYHRENVDISKLTSYFLSGPDFNRISNQMIDMTRPERLQIPGMIELRVDMVVVAVCLVKYILDLMKTQDIMVSTYSLKEGVLYTLLDQGNSK